MASIPIPPGMPPPPLPDFWRKAPSPDRVATLSSTTSSQASAWPAQGQTSPKVKEHGYRQQIGQQQTILSAPPPTHHITFASPPTPTPLIRPGGPASKKMTAHAHPRSIFTLQPHASDDPPPLAVYHICRICFRPRSERYHREHPIPLNVRPPPPGICRRCRVTSIEDTERVGVLLLSKSSDVKLGLRSLMPEENYVSGEEMREARSRELLSKDRCGNRQVFEVKSTGPCKQKDEAAKQRKDATYRYVTIRHKPRSRSRSRVEVRSKVAATSQEAIEASLSNSGCTPRANRTAAVAVEASVKVKPDSNPSVPPVTAKKSTAQSAKLDDLPETDCSISITSEAQARVRLNDHGHGSSSQTVSAKSQSVADMKAIAQPTESKIRKIAREEIERYRQAERKLDAHKAPFAHGRMVPVGRRISQATDKSQPAPWEESLRTSKITIEGGKRIVDALPRHTTRREEHNVSVKQGQHFSDAARGARGSKGFVYSHTSQRVATSGKQTYEHKVSPEHDRNGVGLSSHDRLEQSGPTELVEMSGALPSSSNSSSRSEREHVKPTKISKSDAIDARKETSRSLSVEQSWGGGRSQEERSGWQGQTASEICAGKAAKSDERDCMRYPAQAEASGEAELREVTDPWMDTQDGVRTPDKHFTRSADAEKHQAISLMSRSQGGGERKPKHKDSQSEASTARRSGASTADSKTTIEKQYHHNDAASGNDDQYKASGSCEDGGGDAGSEHRSSSWRDEGAKAQYTTKSRWQGGHVGRQAADAHWSRASSQHSLWESPRPLSPQVTVPRSLHSNTAQSHASRGSAAPSKQSNVRSESGYLGGDSEYMYTVRTVTPANRPVSERELDQVLGHEYKKTEEYVRRRKRQDSAAARADRQSNTGGTRTADVWNEAPASNAPSQATNLTAKSRVSEAGTVGTDGTRSVRFAKKVDFSPTPPNSEASSSQFHMIGARGGSSAHIQLEVTESLPKRRQSSDLTAENLHRGRSRSRDTTAGYNSGAHEDFIFVDEMEYIPRSSRRPHEPVDSTNSGHESPALMHALSESPSRERLNEMLDAPARPDVHSSSHAGAGPYRAFESRGSRPGSMDVDDGSNAPTRWSQQGSRADSGVPGMSW
nr:hypothetical protein CFP56_22226 [Quercus suber]